MADYQFITRVIDRAVATITFNRPQVLNAVSPAVVDELGNALDGLKKDGARALILTGAGRAFCAGADLGGRDLGDRSPGDRIRKNLQRHYNPAMLALSGLDIPIVTAINGAAAGVAVCTAHKNDPAHWVQAGRTCQRFALKATTLGMKHAFINQPVKVARLRPLLASLVGLPGRRPDIVIRFGYGPALPFSARRPTKTVLR